MPHSLLLYTRVNDYNNDLFEISDDEDEAEILRRSSTDTYYLEKMKVFEETFGIDKLQSMVNKIEDKIDDETQYDPSSGKFLMKNEELHLMMK